MTGFEWLLREDGTEFERVLQRALNSTEIQQALWHSAGAVNAEQLRTRALQANAEIAATANAEYAAYLRSRIAAARTGWLDGGRLHEETRAQGRAQLAAVLAVLVPVLAASAAVVFLVLGYGLRLVLARQGLAGQLVTAGWTSAAVSAVAALSGVIKVVIAAAHNLSASTAEYRLHEDPEIERIRTVWHRALLERGIMPFLRRQLAAQCGRRHLVR